MRNIILSILMIFVFSNQAKSQIATHKLIVVGYDYQNYGFGEIGGRLLFLKNDNFLFRVGASALLGSVNNDFAIMPKIQADFLFNKAENVDLYHSHYFLVGAEVTNKYVAPKIGISLFGLIDMTGGYGFSLSGNGINGKQLKGVNANFTINIPIVFIR